MTSDLELRVRFAVDDMALSKLHAESFAFPAVPASITVDPWSARLDRHSLTWVGAFDVDELVGFVHACWDGGRHAFLLDTVVGPRYRHRGVGGSLVQLLTREVTGAGCHWLHVDFEPALQAFYMEAGFQTTSAGLIRLR